MKPYSKPEIAEIAVRHSIPIDEDWSGPGQLWPLLERMMEEGSVVVLKLDGARKPEQGDNGRFTIVASGGLLGDNVIRGDFETIDEGLCYLVGNYEQVHGSG